MTAALAALVGVHMLVAAVIIIGALLHRLQDTPLTVAVWAARIQVLLGLVLVGLNQAADEDLSIGWIIVKFIIGIGVLGMLEGAQKRSSRGEATTPLVEIAAGLAIVNVVVAFTWH